MEFAMGAALIMAMHLDLLVAAESARLGMIEARFGGVGAETLPFLVSIQWAKFLMLSGEIITATRAREIGLVLEVFPDDRFAAKVDDLARRVSAMPRQGVMFNRRLINDTVTAMGWSPVQKEMAIAMNTVVSSQMSEALALNGRTLLKSCATMAGRLSKRHVTRLLQRRGLRTRPSAKSRCRSRRRCEASDGSEYLNLWGQCACMCCCI